MANLLDKVIGYVSPATGAARVAARRRMEILDGARGYEAASKGRLGKNWNAPSSSADREIGKAGQTLRNRSRDLIRNHPLAAKIVNAHVNNFVGFGITPRVKTGDKKKDLLVSELFDEWAKVCFVGVNQDFYGGTALLARMMVSDGEVFVRRRYRLAEDNLPVPLQLQILDSEFCDWGKTSGVPGHPANAVLQGVEFDALGNRRGYWLHQQNPGLDISWSTRIKSAFVPAEEVVHLYEPHVNQVHGVPWLTPVMNEIRDLKDYELSENIRKKVESCMVGMVIPGDDDVDTSDPNVGLEERPGDSLDVTVTDVHGHPFERMEPGMFGVLRGGKDIRFNSPAVSAGIEAYIRTRQRSIAAGARIPYEIMTGDFSQANFASGKLGLLEYQRFVGMVQWHILIPNLNTIFGWFITAAKQAGKIPMNLKVAVEWAPPEAESITRLDDARADLIEMRMGKRSPQEIISRTGREPSEVLKEIDEWNAMVDATASKVILDNDPRKVAINGQAQWGIALDGSDSGGSSAKDK